MIVIFTLTSNINGHLVIQEKKTSDLHDLPARVSRFKTLDGSAYINHSGISDGDRTLKVIAKLSEVDRTKLINIYKTETFVGVTIPDGVFRAVISNIKRKKADTVITIMIEQKETA